MDQQLVLGLVKLVWLQRQGGLIVYLVKTLTGIISLFWPLGLVILCSSKGCLLVLLLI